MLLRAVLMGLLLAYCGESTPTSAPSGATLRISANPTSIPATNGTSTITDTGFKSEEDGGGTLADGTQILFKTTVGVIEERVEMKDGVARAVLRSTGRSGTATVTASSGSLAPVTVDVRIGLESVIIVSASPATVSESNPTSLIVATVFDDSNNLLSDAPVVFSTSAGALASRGTTLRTDANGQATDRLDLNDAASAVVTAASGAASGTVTVNRAGVTVPQVLSVSPDSGEAGSTLSVTVNGSDFENGATVSFGPGITVTSVTWVSATNLNASITISPNATPGARSVSVSNPGGGSGSLSAGFNVEGVPEAVTVTRVQPNSALQGQTVTVTISGSGFQLDATVSFGSGITVNTVTFSSSSTLQVSLTVAEDAAEGTRDVTVTNGDNSTGTLPSGFTVNSA